MTKITKGNWAKFLGRKVAISSDVADYDTGLNLSKFPGSWQLDGWHNGNVSVFNTKTPESYRLIPAHLVSVKARRR